MSLRLRQVNPEVFFSTDDFSRIGPAEIAFLKNQAAMSNRRRARICAHASNENSLHEMIIVAASDTYIHPHRHNNKSESFHIIEGEVDIVMFDNDGGVTDIIELGDISSKKPFFYRLSDERFHTLCVHSEFLIFHEVTNGPFVPGDTVLAAFAPDAGDSVAVGIWNGELERRVAQYRQFIQEHEGLTRIPN
jgi:cupin fold WbuC family metalloprotein